jgi:hypothetical protein
MIEKRITIVDQKVPAMQDLIGWIQGESKHRQIVDRTLRGVRGQRCWQTPAF